MDIRREASAALLLLPAVMLVLCAVSAEPVQRLQPRAGSLSDSMSSHSANTDVSSRAAATHNFTGSLKAHRNSRRGPSILEQMDIPTVTRAFASDADVGGGDEEGDVKDTWLPPLPTVPARVPSPHRRRTTAARLHPKLLQSSRSARLITKQKYLKKDWCKTEPLVRRLREPGCRSRRVIDRFCYGQCNSFFIPREDGRRHGRRAFKSCPSCRPRRWNTVTVTFRCSGQGPPLRRRAVRLVAQCRCMNRSPRR